jgi:formylglycine-generating enzyme required for sulfatase activity
MHGNVGELCQDWYSDYAGGIAVDPQGPATGLDHVIRGGSWYYWDACAGYCRSADRDCDSPADIRLDVGFRVVLAPGQP